MPIHFKFTIFITVVIDTCRHVCAYGDPLCVPIGNFADSGKHLNVICYSLHKIAESASVHPLGPFPLMQAHTHAHVHVYVCVHVHVQHVYVHVCTLYDLHVFPGFPKTTEIAKSVVDL